MSGCCSNSRACTESGEREVKTAPYGGHGLNTWSVGTHAGSYWCIFPTCEAVRKTKDAYEEDKQEMLTSHLSCTETLKPEGGSDLSYVIHYQKEKEKTAWGAALVQQRKGRSNGQHHGNGHFAGKLPVATAQCTVPAFQGVTYQAHHRYIVLDILLMGKRIICNSGQCKIGSRELTEEPHKPSNVCANFFLTSLLIYPFLKAALVQNWQLISHVFRHRGVQKEIKKKN